MPQDFKPAKNLRYRMTERADLRDATEAEEIIEGLLPSKESLMISSDGSIDVKVSCIIKKRVKWEPYISPSKEMDPLSRW